MPLTPDDYLTHLQTETAKFRAALVDADSTASVPTCPDWTAEDLLWHLCTVQHFWADIIVGRPGGPEGVEEPARPEGQPALLALFDEGVARLQAALTDAAATEPAWSWSGNPADQTVAFTQRRQAHEALIHRLDAELVIGKVTDLDPVLAADGVREAMGVMYGGCPPWGTFTPGEQTLRLDCTDTGDEIWVRFGRFTGTDPDDDKVYDEVDLELWNPPTDTEPGAVIDGPAGAMDAWIWSRGDDSALAQTGDPDVLATFRGIISQPIN